MDMTDGLISPLLSYTALLAWLALLLVVLRGPDLRRLRDTEQLHVFLGATVAMLALWMLRAGIDAGLNLHLLAVTAITLMFGWRLAALSVSIVLLATTYNTGGGWVSLGLNFLVMGLAPILWTELLLRLAQRLLPLNFFVYVFVNAFVCGGLSIVLVGALSSLLMLMFGPYSGAYLVDHYLNFYSLMFFPEAVFNGMVMTLLVAYRPQWTHSFVDELYLRDK